LNPVERWLVLITTQAIRRGSFDSVADLKRKIDEFVKHYHQHPKPFTWTATAESILAKIERLGKGMSESAHAMGLSVFVDQTLRPNTRQAQCILDHPATSGDPHAAGGLRPQ
jgi:hypothetical protein